MTTSETPRSQRGSAIDAWLHAGGIVIAATERAARALRGAFNRRREADGQTAWATPAIYDWRAFVRRVWDREFADDRVLLSGLQEEWLFGQIAQRSEHNATVLHGPRMRLAAMAREAHDLLCTHAAELLPSTARPAWPGDAETFSAWLAEFDQICAREGWLSATRLPLEIIQRIEDNAPEREPLLLVGFDRLTATQKRFFDAWGKYEQIADAGTAETRFYEVADAASELAACALWCRSRLQADHTARLLIISQDAGQRRGEIERAFARYLDGPSADLVEFSLGVPLSRTPLVHAGLLVLRWISNKALAEYEVDWLIAGGVTTASEAESASLQRHMRKIRNRQMQRPEWTLEEFINGLPNGDPLPESWVQRMLSAARRLHPIGQRRSALEWSELLPLSMNDAGFPGCHPMPSANFQVMDHWRKAVEACGTLGFDERTISWPTFHSAVARQMEDTLFTPEATAANILVSGPAQSAGLVADGIWFLGAEEGAWPFASQLHPFLPAFVQRNTNMPQASAQADAKLAGRITDRLLHAASECVFSSVRLRCKVDANPSRMILSLVGDPVPVPDQLVPERPVQAVMETFPDSIAVPFSGNIAPGGATTLTMQSRCPFRAFATFRMGAQPWDLAETGLTPRQRGDLVHSVLRAVWGGAAVGGWTTSDELQAVLASEGLEGVERFVAAHVEQVLMHSMPATVRDRIPKRCIALELERLTKLVTEWLLYESTRAQFTVSGTEQRSQVVIAGLAFDLRLDRLDTLNDGTSLIVDYKTGASTSLDSWSSARPDDVQLPLYGVFGVGQGNPSELGGLAFAKVLPGAPEFIGRVRNNGAFLPSVSNRNQLTTNPLSDQQIDVWRSIIEQLAADFLHGRAVVDPKDSDSCKYCELCSLCRIDQMQAEDADSTQP